MRRATWPRLAVDYAELAGASQRVIDARLRRAARCAGGRFTARDHVEFSGMVTEKFFALVESTQAMALAMATLQSQAVQAGLRTWLWPWLGWGGLPAPRLPARWPAPLLAGAPWRPDAHARRVASRNASIWARVAAAGLAPIARRAHANDRRLRRVVASS
jgi:hypothetical protein